jgi:hypothetical protein
MERNVSMKVIRSWGKLWDKVKIAYEIIKFLNNRTSEVNETLEINDRIYFIMEVSTMNIKHILITSTQNKC